MSEIGDTHSFHRIQRKIEKRHHRITKIDSSACPVLYDMTACRYEILLGKGATRWRDQVENSQIHKGNLSLQGRHVNSWEAPASLILAHVDTKCNLISTKLFLSPKYTKDINVTYQVKQFLRSIPKGHLLLGDLFHDYETFCDELVDLGAYEENSRHPFTCNRSVTLFQFRKGYPGHSKILTTTHVDRAINLTGNFHFGHGFSVALMNISYGTLISRHRDIIKGGKWKPKTCETKWKIALIIPFRSRETHLKIFLDNIIRFLQSQLIGFQIFVIEQAGDVIFNRAMLLNIGYKEAKKFGVFNCFVFHDVDQIPEDLSNSYGCSRHPRHMVVTRSVTAYRLRYPLYFGGGIMLRKDHVELINGFPNRYFGWGGEDDDILERILHSNLRFDRYPKEIASYRSLAHNFDEYNPHVTRKGKEIREKATNFIKEDGLNNLVYDVISVEERALHTHIIVSFPGPRTVDEIRSVV